MFAGALEILTRIYYKILNIHHKLVKYSVAKIYELHTKGHNYRHSSSLEKKYAVFILKNN
jgi:hypothetical protein